SRTATNRQSETEIDRHPCQRLECLVTNCCCPNRATMSRNINIGGGNGAGPPPMPYPLSSSLPPGADFFNAQFAMQQQQQQNLRPQSPPAHLHHSQQQQRQRMQSPPQAMLSSSFPSNSFPAAMMQQRPPMPPQQPQPPLPTPQQIGMAIMSSIEDHLMHHQHQQQQFAHSQSMHFPGHQQFPHQHPQHHQQQQHPGAVHAQQFQHPRPPPSQFPPQPHPQHQHHHPGQQQRPPLPQNFIAQQQPQQQPPPPPAKQDPPLPQEVAMIDMAAGLGAAWSTGDDRQQQRQGQSVAMATKQKQPHQQVVQPVRRQRLNSLHRSSSDPEFFTGRRRHFVPVQHKQQQAAGKQPHPAANKQAAIDAGLARLRLNSCKADQLQSIVTEPGTAAARPEAAANSNSQAQAEPAELTSEPMPAAPSTIQETDADETAQTAEAAAEEEDDEAPDEAEVHGLEDPMRCPPDTDTTLHEACSALLTYSRSTGEADSNEEVEDEEATVSAEAAAVAAAEDAAKHAHLDKIVSHEALAEKLSTQAEEKPVPLQTTWILYLSRNSEWTSNEDYLARLQRLNTIKSVQSFWATLRYVPKVDLLPTKACYHFMRDDRLPIWETDYHIEGGSFRFKCPKLHTATIWQELLLAAIGEQLSDWLAKGDDVSGVSCSVRESQDIVEIWHTRADLASKASIFENVPKLLPRNTKFLASFHKAFRDNYRAHMQQQKRQQLAADSQTSASPPGLGGGQRVKRSQQRKSIGH
ncbi:hypothetical protein BOX15_Mlig032536g2, partial [Macrostomum lignano]